MKHKEKLKTKCKYCKKHLTLELLTEENDYESKTMITFLISCECKIDKCANEVKQAVLPYEKKTFSISFREYIEQVLPLVRLQFEEHLWTKPRMKKKGMRWDPKKFLKIIEKNWPKNL